MPPKRGAAVRQRTGDSGLREKTVKSNATAKRSSHFKHTSESESEDDVSDEYSEFSAEDSVDDDESEDGAVSDEEVEAEEDEEEDERRSKKRGGKVTKAAPKRLKTSGGGDDDEEFDATEIFIPKNPPRGLGGVEYQQDAIHPNTILFLRDLKLNNEREWFWDHEAEYRAAKKDFDDFVEVLSEKMSEIDDTIPPLPLKDVLYRIYRDIRFTNDKTPFKPYFAASYSRTGRSGYYAHYYVHFEPGNFRVGAGMWHISEGNGDGLQTMRRLIDRGGKRLKAIINHPDMAKYYFTDPDVAPLDQFVLMNQGDALKKCPKGYPKDHKDIKLLRLKSYTVSAHLSDDDFKPGQKPIEKIVPILKAAVPFVQFLNAVVMDNEETDDSDAEQDDEE